MKDRQMEIPVNNNSIVTSRSLKNTHPDNLNLYESSQEFQDLLREVKIRFDTNPKFYLREDYHKLIELIRKKGGGSGGDIDINITSDGDVITNITAEGNTLNVTKGRARYPRVRWARRGFIDLTNCKDIDYIIVPCTTKQLCLYVTNDYLKSLRHVETYESIYGQDLEYDDEDPIIPEDFFKVISQYFDNVVEVQSHTYNQPRVLNEYDENKLPCTTNIDLFINVKEFAITKAPSNCNNNPLKVLFNRKDVHHGFIQFPYFRFGKRDINNNSESTSYYLNTRFIFTPYMVFANPFNSTLGGVIPVKDGKLLIEKATRLKNKTLELISTGELIRFDELGICDTLFNPKTYIHTTLKAGRQGGGWKKQPHLLNIKRRSSANVRRRVRMNHGMEHIKNHHNRDIGMGWGTTKWIEQVPYVITKKNYKFNDDGVYNEDTNCLILKTILKVSHEDIIKYIVLANPLTINKYRYDIRKYHHEGYLVFTPNTPHNYHLNNGLVKYYKACYDRMNTYTINKYAPFIRIFRRFRQLR